MIKFYIESMDVSTGFYPMLFFAFYDILKVRKMENDQAFRLKHFEVY